MREFRLGLEFAGAGGRGGGKAVPTVAKRGERGREFWVERDGNDRELTVGRPGRLRYRSSALHDRRAAGPRPHFVPDPEPPAISPSLRRASVIRT